MTKGPKISFKSHIKVISHLNSQDLACQFLSKRKLFINLKSVAEHIPY